VGVAISEAVHYDCIPLHRLRFPDKKA